MVFMRKRGRVGVLRGSEQRFSATEIAVAMMPRHLIPDFRIDSVDAKTRYFLYVGRS